MPVIKRKFLRASQAALEFLMTYGWAIIVVLIAIGTLAYFGVLSPDKFLPEKCILPPGIACLDYRVENYKVILALQNSLGEAITINSVKISVNSQQCFDNESITLKNNDKALITITECNNGAEGDKFDGVINVSYAIEERLTHIALGTLQTRIVAGSPLSSQNICQNAKNNDLCDGLDIVYGIGYQAACCSEHNLCC